jgi:hypothetical protein
LAAHGTSPRSAWSTPVRSADQRCLHCLQRLSGRAMLTR